MGKIMISLDDKTEQKLRLEVGRLYHGKVGGLSILFEQLVRQYFKEKHHK